MGPAGVGIGVLGAGDRDWHAVDPELLGRRRFAIANVLSVVVAESVPDRDFAQGAGINMTARQLGGALGVAFVAAVLGPHGGSDLSDFTTPWPAIASASAITALGGTALLRRKEPLDRAGARPRPRLPQGPCVRLKA